MSTRKKISVNVERDILIKSRRRCCICFGLDRDLSQKKGQIAHLDNNASNNNFENLAFLCLDHHDEFDSKTRQSKGLTIHEVKEYRNELYAYYDHWHLELSSQQKLNFLASSVTFDQMADMAVRTAGQIYAFPENLALAALSDQLFESVDGDRYAPFLFVLEEFESWGWVEYEVDEYIEEDDGPEVVRIRIKHKEFCSGIAEILHSRIESKGMQPGF